MHTAHALHSAVRARAPPAICSERCRNRAVSPFQPHTVSVPPPHDSSHSTSHNRTPACTTEQHSLTRATFPIICLPTEHDPCSILCTHQAHASPHRAPEAARAPTVCKRCGARRRVGRGAPPFTGSGCSGNPALPVALRRLRLGLSPFTSTRSIRRRRSAAAQNCSSAAA